MSSPVIGLDHVQVSCPTGSEDSLRAFYAGVLGFDEVAQPAALAARGGVWFQAGSAQLHCGVEPDFRPARKAHPAFALSDVAGLDALAARLRSAGVEIEWSDDVPGVRRFHCADAVGNRLEFTASVSPSGTGSAART
jgi:catechol 2,3-dioxygenase-like lactoylglutathione lyase family enzyme